MQLLGGTKMNIITTNNASKSIQSWNTSTLPEGYAWLPDTIDTTEFYAYNGFVSVTVENDIVTVLVPDVEAWAAWKAEQPTEEDAAAAEVREERDTLIATTDWTQVLDAPLTTECVEAFRVYRQALRDITEQEGFPLEVTWPEVPETVKAEVVASA